MNRHYMLEALLLSSGRRLPSAYQEVEYIESTGEQYIDTGFVPNSNSRMVADYKATRLIRSTHAVAGVRSDSSVNCFGFGGRSSGYFYASYANEQTPAQIFLEDTNRHLVDLNRNLLLFDGNVVHTFANETFVSMGSIYIFRWHEPSSTISYGAEARIYSIRLYSNYILVRDFVPCYRKADGEIGLYDLVNNVFYTNQGTGTFLKGPDVK